MPTITLTPQTYTFTGAAINLSATITSLSVQPVTDSINAAYRPIVLSATLTGIAPIVFCDIYFNDLYYKTLSITAVAGLEAEFDIQDAAQEYLYKYIAPVGGALTYPALSIFTKVFCRFRASSINNEGLTIIEPVIPIQGTDGVSPIAGTGYQSNTFYIINATLQHEDNQDLATHLASFKTGTWNSSLYPLSHRKDGYRVVGSDYFPVIYPTETVPDCLKITYTKKDGTTGTLNTCGIYADCEELTILDIVPVDNGNGTQTFTFTWNTPPTGLTSVEIQYRDHAGPGAWNTAFTYPLISPQVVTLPLGKYDFRFITIGSCNPAPSESWNNYGIEPAVCVPLAITGGFPLLPDAVANVPYNMVITFTSGSLPVSYIITSGPSWLRISIFGLQVTFYGTPLFADIDDGIPIDITFSNACSDISLSDSIDVTSPITENSWILFDEGSDITKAMLLKNNVPSYVLVNPQTFFGGVPINFLAPNETSADYKLLFADTTVLGSADLYCPGTLTHHAGTISAGYVEWNGINIVKGMQITLNL